MTDLLRSHIISATGSEPADLDKVISHFTPMQVKRNTTLLNEGEVCRHVYFVAKGCVQVFTIDDKGNETTRDFVFENNWVSQLDSFGNRKPSTENIRTVEPCRLLSISYENFGLLMNSVPQFAKVYQAILELSFNKSVYRINTFVAMDALARMKWLLQHQPQILTRISSKAAASYLGITPETFTRLKARL